MSRARLLALLALSLTTAAAAVVACATDDAVSPDAGTDGAAARRDATSGDDDTGVFDAGGGGSDARVEGGSDASFDGACLEASVVPQTGETCAGFGRGEPCEPACGHPAFGYVCFDGGPPNLSGCVQVRKSFLGETYCCPKNDCVRVPDLDTECAGQAGGSRLYQCPPEGDGGTAAPPSPACSPKTVAASPYKYHCCPQ